MCARDDGRPGRRLLPAEAVTDEQRAVPGAEPELVLLRAGMGGSRARSRGEAEGDHEQGGREDEEGSHAHHLTRTRTDAGSTAVPRPVGREHGNAVEPAGEAERRGRVEVRRLSVEGANEPAVDQERVRAHAAAPVESRVPRHPHAAALLRAAR